MATKKRSKSANVDLEKSFYDTAKKMNRGKYNQKKAKKGRGAAAMLVILSALLFGLIFGFLYLGGFIGGRTIAGNIHIVGVNLSGMNRSQAVSAINKAVDGYASKSMEVTVGTQTVVISGSTAKVSVDTEKAVTMAFLQQFKGGEFDAAPYVSIDTTAVRKALSTFDELTQESTFTESKYTIVGNRPGLDAAHAEDPVQKIEVYTGTPSLYFVPNALYAAVLDAYRQGNMTVDYTIPTETPSPIDFVAIHNSLYSAPVNATMDKTTFKITPHTYGYGLDVAAAQKLVSETPYGQKVTIPCIRITPEVTAESLSANLYCDVLSTFTAVATSQGDRDINLKLSCEALNGIVLMPGEVFSYNQTLGERTPEKGYKPATSYMGADVIQTYGGGICQASSALYYCTLIADLEIVERHNHGYISSYVPYGMDATVDWSGPDFKFKNTTDYPICIEAEADGGTVIVTLKGTDTKDHYVKMEYELLSVEEYQVLYQEIPYDNNPKGYKDGDVINSPYTGYDVKTYRCRYSKETDELLSKDLEVHSRYMKRDKLVAKIVGIDPSESTGISPDE